MTKKCKYCKYCKENHYEKEGEKPYIKYVCDNRFGISDYSQIEPDSDYCSRFEERELPNVAVGDEVIVDGCKGIIVREPYQIGNLDDPLILVLVWYGYHMGDAKLQDIQTTGKKNSEIVKILKELREADNDKTD